MKKAWRCGVLCVLLYLLALVVTAPARLVLRVIPEPIPVTAVTGSIWAGHFLNLRWKNVNVGSLRWRWGWYNGSPGVRLVASGGDVQGTAQLGWFGNWRVSDAYLTASAQQILAITGVVLPLELQGAVSLSLETLHFTREQCQALTARVDWQDARVSALGQALTLGKPQLDLRCEGTKITAALRQEQAPLPFSAQGQLSFDGEYRLSGQTGPTDALPAPWTQMINSVTRPAPDGQRIMELSGKWTLYRR